MFTINVDQEIQLHLFQLQDSGPLFQLVHRNREHFRQWLPWIDSIFSPAQFQSIISGWLRQYYDKNGFQLGIRYRNHLIGAIGLHSIDWYNKQTTIGYYLAQGFEGKGIMTKSVQALLDYIFHSLKLHRVEIRCGVNNHKSRAIPIRLGFKEEGVIRDGEFLYDHYHDLVVYGMLAHEWHSKSKKHHLI
ncbi:GNAT family protein [Niallia sp. XMNu-256]|uniref:GNAT family N-acetyltransferase n=1 Tax=Niallia sp. XMNu-256 TaxID=3082444 RepID=UPI0030D1A33F